MIRTQLRIPVAIWDGMKIQAVREKMSAEKLTAKAFEFYLRQFATGDRVHVQAAVQSVGAAAIEKYKAENTGQTPSGREAA